MKTILCCLIACLSLSAAVAVAGDEKPWLDPQNCQMCTALTEHPGLMEHMNWETHAIGSGMLSVTTVDPEYLEAYREAQKKMEATGQELAAGKTMNLCGCCTSIGGLMMAGAMMENVSTKTGAVMLVTSGDKAVAAKIKAHAEKTIKEWDKLMMETHEGHEGHGKSGH